MHKFTAKATSLALIVATLSGCSAFSGATYGSIAPQVAKDKLKAEKLMVPPASTSVGAANYSEKSWLPVRKIVRSDKEIASAKTDGILIEINQRFINLNEVVGTISSLTGLPVYVGADVTSPTGALAAGPAAAGPGVSPFAPPPPPTSFPSLPPLPGSSSSPFSAAANPSPFAPASAITASSAFSANYSGSLTGLMNLVSAYYGVFWKLDDKGLRFYKMESRTFRIVALPGDMHSTSAVEASASSAGGGGGSSVSTQSGSSSNSTGVGFAGLSVWTSLETAVKQMLTPNGRVFASPATGTITVTDTPSVMVDVAEFISNQNASMSRQVSVNVRVLSVEVNEGDDYGINWDSIYSNLASVSNPYSIALKAAFPAAVGGGNLVISAPANSTSRWAGANAMISALSTQGHVSELTSSTLVTLNNQPTPVNVGRKVSYLASSSTSQTPNVGSTSSLTPGSVQTGFSMTLLPHIIDGRELLLQYSLDLSSLLRLSTITSGTSSIQAPDIATSNFIQRVRMMSGETLVVAGFDQDNLSAVSNGIGSATNPVLGERNGTKKRSLLVVLIQPNISAQ